MVIQRYLPTTKNGIPFCISNKIYFNLSYFSIKCVQGIGSLLSSSYTKDFLDGGSSNELYTDANNRILKGEI